jgi:hypothetical protein
MIFLFIVSEKSWMLLNISLDDSSVDNFCEELNVNTINRNIMYTNSQEHSTLFRNYQQNYHIHKSSGTFNSSLILSIEISYTQKKSWMSLTICVYDSSIDNIRKKLNVLDNLCISYTQIVKNIQLFSDIINRTIMYTNRQ